MDRETLEGLSKKDLAEMAREKGVAGFRSLTKEKLVEALAALLTPRGRARKSARARGPESGDEKTKVVAKAVGGPAEKAGKQGAKAEPEALAPIHEAKGEAEAVLSTAEARAEKPPRTLSRSLEGPKGDKLSKAETPGPADEPESLPGLPKAGNAGETVAAEEARKPRRTSKTSKTTKTTSKKGDGSKAGTAGARKAGGAPAGKTERNSVPERAGKVAEAGNRPAESTGALEGIGAPKELNGQSPGSEPGFKPAEAFLDDVGTEVEFERGPDGQPVLGPDGKPMVKARPRFKKTSKVEDLLEVDESLGELPPSYDEDRAVLLVRDPQWAYAYWDMRQTLARRDPARGDYRQILRVQELSGSEDRAAYFYDVPLPPHARSWYLKLPGDGRRYRVEVGLHYRDGSYAAVAVSNAIEMPRARPSEVVADTFVTLPLEPETAPDRPSTTSLPPVAEWMVAPENASTVASVAPPLAPVAGRPSPAPTLEPSVPATGWEEAQIRPWAHPWSGHHPFMPEQGAIPGAPGLSGPVSSHAVSSWGLAPGASEELQRGPRAKDFWLVADAELIVYGATEPDAKVTLRGERIPLRPDGTFSFRFYLPDGVHPIPIRALNADEDDERMITITVSRRTEGDGKTNLRKS